MYLVAIAPSDFRMRHEPGIFELVDDSMNCTFRDADPGRQLSDANVGNGADPGEGMAVRCEERPFPSCSFSHNLMFHSCL